MQPAISLTQDNAPALAKLYLEGFALFTVVFLLSLVIRPEDQAQYGVVALAVGGIACVLLRISERVIEGDVETEPSATAPATPERQLLREVGSMMEQAARDQTDVGVMLISIFSSVEEDPSELRTVDFVRAELYWAADFNVHDLGDQLLAITSAAPGLEVDLERLAATLQKEVQRRRALSTASGTEELTIGAAIAHGATVKADEILANARAALARAKGTGRRILFRHL